MPVILRLGSGRLESGKLAPAARILRDGGIAVFPTETVYGLGTDSRNRFAVERLVALKRRPGGQPLLIHCATESQLSGLVSEVTDQARRLMAVFWPGPLAIVLKRGPSVAVHTGGSGETIGVRMVASRVARALITELGAPIAGTSANYHDCNAPAAFDQVDKDLLDKVDVAVDAGRCEFGIPSTVLDLTTEPARIVRQGLVSVEQISGVLGYQPVLSAG